MTENKLDGSGTKDDPYIVQTKEDYITSTDKTDSVINLKQIETIDLTTEIKEKREKSWKKRLFIGTPIIIGLTVASYIFLSLFASIIILAVSSIVTYFMTIPEMSEYRYKNFSGVLDGNYNKIEVKGLDKSLFKNIEEDGVVKNLCVQKQNVNISMSNKGAIADVNKGIMRHIIVEDATIEGVDNVGGIVGKNNGYMSGCSVVNSTVNGSSFVGGVVGICSDGYIRDCGSIETSVIAEESNISDEEDNTYAGGFVGKIENNSVIRDSYASGDITNSDTGQFVGDGYDDGYLGDSVIKRCVASVEGASRCFGASDKIYYFNCYFDDSYNCDRLRKISTTDLHENDEVKKKGVKYKETLFIEPYDKEYSDMNEHELIENKNHWLWSSRKNRFVNRHLQKLNDAFDTENFKNTSVKPSDEQMQFMNRNPKELVSEFETVRINIDKPGFKEYE
jgi:hypothetical protein